jgi:hypothetical protein
MKKIILLLIVISIIFLYYRPDYFLSNQQTVQPSINFPLLLKCAHLCKESYESKEDLEKKYGNKIVLKKALPQFGGWFFILEEKTEKELYIAVRGTPVPYNGYKNMLLGILTDIEIPFVKDSLLQLDLHAGFRAEAYEIFKIIQPILETYQQKGYHFIITGHSLGGAVAGILMLYFEHHNYPLEHTITFGQPKFTNTAGMEKLRNHSLFRISNAKDPVTFLPPGNVLDDFKTGYRHFGEELILLDSIFYSYLNNQEAEQGKITSLIDNMGEEDVWEHRLDDYIKALEAKLEKRENIPFDARKRYFK